MKKMFALLARQLQLFVDDRDRSLQWRDDTSAILLKLSPLDDLLQQFQENLNVYGKDGEPDPIEKDRMSGLCKELLIQLKERGVSGRRRSPVKSAAGSSVGSNHFGTTEKVALSTGIVLLLIVFITLCLLPLPGLAMAKCLRVFLALGCGLLSFLILGSLAIHFERDKMQVGCTGGLAVFVLLGVVYDPLDAKPFLAQIGLLKPDANIEKVQKILEKETDYKSSRSGVADSKFAAEILNVQRNNQLPETGVLNAETFSALGRLQKGEVVLYSTSHAYLNTDGPAGEGKKDASWLPITSLKDSQGKSIDSRVVPVLVIQQDHIGESKLKLGDFAIVYSSQTNRIGTAIIGDVSPRARATEVRPMEVSMAVLDQLNLAESGHGYDLTALVFAQSATDPVDLSSAQIEAKAKDLFEKWGGESKLRSLLPGS